MTDPDFIGVGWRFPIQVDARGRIATSNGGARVQDAIWIIVRTSLGERVMLPRFGAGTDDYVFQPNSPASRAALAAAVRTALLQWEPRIDLDAVRVDEVPGEPSQVRVAVEYHLRTTNEAFNMVYPFFLQGGTL
jgi:phage baseplate assembly protein W